MIDLIEAILKNSLGDPKFLDFINMSLICGIQRGNEMYGTDSVGDEGTRDHSQYCYQLQCLIICMSETYPPSLYEINC